MNPNKGNLTIFSGRNYLPISRGRVIMAARCCCNGSWCRRRLLLQWQHAVVAAAVLPRRRRSAAKEGERSSESRKKKLDLRGEVERERERMYCSSSNSPVGRRRPRGSGFWKEGWEIDLQAVGEEWGLFWFIYPFGSVLGLRGLRTGVRFGCIYTWRMQAIPDYIVCHLKLPIQTLRLDYVRCLFPTMKRFYVDPKEGGKF